MPYLIFFLVYFLTLYVLSGGPVGSKSLSWPESSSLSLSYKYEMCLREPPDVLPLLPEHPDAWCPGDVGVVRDEKCEGLGAPPAPIHGVPLHLTVRHSYQKYLLREIKKLIVQFHRHPKNPKFCSLRHVSFFKGLRLSTTNI